MRYMQKTVYGLMTLLLFNMPDNRPTQQILLSRPLGIYRQRQKDNIKMDLT